MTMTAREEIRRYHQQEAATPASVAEATFPITRLDDLLRRWRDEEIDDALDDLSSAVEELVELANQDREIPDRGTLQMEVDKWRDRAETALARLEGLKASQ